jgi:hypothetical protein
MGVDFSPAEKFGFAVCGGFSLLVFISCCFRCMPRGSFTRTRSAVTQWRKKRALTEEEQIEKAIKSMEAKLLTGLFPYFPGL